MRLLYNNKGEILYAVPDYQWYYFKHSTNIPLTEMVIEENVENKERCIDLLRTYSKLDEAEEQKYKVEKGKVVEKEGWVEYIEPTPTASIE